MSFVGVCEKFSLEVGGGGYKIFLNFPKFQPTPLLPIKKVKSLTTMHVWINQLVCFVYQ